MPTVFFDGTLHGWRVAARALLAAEVAPDDAVWRSAADAQGALALGGEGEVRPAGGGVAAGAAAGTPPAPLARRVPQRFLALAGLVACHREPGRWGALYRVLWRLTLGGEPRLLAVTVDADVLRLTHMAKAVRREVHKMHAFVRFRAAPGGGGDAGGGDDVEYVAWFEPEHDVVARAAPFFVRRFPNMRWAILTPRGTARWDGGALALGPGVPVRQGPRDDSLEALWGVYYAHVFNPARVKLAAMRAEMPKRYWRNLPEARLIDGMVRGAAGRVRRMVEAGAAAGRDGRLGWGVPERAPAGGTPAGGTPAGEAEETTDTGRAGAGEAEGTGTVRVGTAGWGEAADGWYPHDVRTPEARLRHYATRFSLVEVDATFGALPTRTVSTLWGARTPGGFVFDVRAHGLLTGHPIEPRRLPRRVRDLLPPSLAGVNRVMADEIPARVRAAVWDDLLGALAPLAGAGKLGAVLLRFPRWLGPSRAGADALAEAREALGGQTAAVEFGHHDWLAPRLRGRTLALLGRLGFAHTVVDGPVGVAEAVPLVAEVTHPALAVVRLCGRQPRGPNGTLGDTAGRYSAADLEEVASSVEAVARGAREIHVVVDHGGADVGVRDAEAVAGLLRQGRRDGGAAAVVRPDR